MRVVRAGPGELDLVAPLFDAYRVFYGRPSDPAAARAFLAERLERHESVVLLALAADGTAIGFTQLYPSFTSVGLRRLWVLNDLFVAPAARRSGAGRALIEAAVAHGRASGAARLVLETTPDNPAARALYEKLGFGRDGSLHYALGLEAAARP